VNREAAYYSGYGAVSGHMNGHYSNGNTGLFKVNATAVFPRAFYTGYFGGEICLVNVTFTMMLPANVSYFSPFFVETIFFYIPNSTPSVALGYEDITGSGPVVSGESMGGTGTGSWNVTVWTYCYMQAVPHNQFWLSFTGQAVAPLYVQLAGGGNLTAANGSNYYYEILAPFYFQGTPTTFFVFSPSVGTWVGYGVSIFVVVASIFLLNHKPRPKYTENEAGTPA